MVGVDREMGVPGPSKGDSMIEDRFTTAYGGEVDVELDIFGTAPKARITLDDRGACGDGNYLDLHLDSDEARRLAKHLEKMAADLDSTIGVQALTIHALVGLGMLVHVEVDNVCQGFDGCDFDDEAKDYLLRPSAELEEVLRRHKVSWW